MVSPVHISLSEKDITKLILEYLEQRKLNITQVSLERETGIINANLSDDALFLRQLILDGQWDDCIDFVEPLRALPSFDYRHYQFLINKYKFLELICIKQEPGPMQDNAFTVEELVECCKVLETLAPNEDEYKQLCFLLAIPKLSDSPEFKNWNPSFGRVQCFQAVLPLVGSVLNSDRAQAPYAKNDRLIQLLVKGLFYESCVDFCQNKALRQPVYAVDFSPSTLQKSLSIKLEQLVKPKLDAHWTEHILAAPIKPKGAFPHCAVPAKRLRSAEQMSRSLQPGIIELAGNKENRTENCMLTQSVRAPEPFRLVNKSASISSMQKSIDTVLEGPNARQSLGAAGAMGGSIFGGPMVSSTELDIHDSIMETAPQHQQIDMPVLTEEVISPSGTAYDLDVSVYDQLETIKRRSGVPNDYNMRTPRMETPIHNRSTVPLSGATASSSATTGRLYSAFSSKLAKNALNAGAGGLNSTMYQLMNTRIRSQVQTPGPATGHYSPEPSMTHYEAVPSEPKHHPTTPLPKVREVFENGSEPGNKRASLKGPKFLPYSSLEDSQAIRAVSFHPSGRYYAIGTNSRQLHVCKYPNVEEAIQNPNHVCKPAEICLSRPKHHRGSVYCAVFNPTGELLATGSNDKVVKLISFDEVKCKFGAERDLNIHDGTVRDLVFIEDTSNRSSLLISAGAGKCLVYITDCATGTTIRNFQGHTDSPVTSVCVDPNGRLLISGHQDASVMLYDISGSRTIQLYQPHLDEVRTVRFSPGAFYLLSGSYDNHIAITDMRGDLMAPLSYLPVAEHKDKIIQCRWHPKEFTFLSTSADKTATLWALPPQL